jgi:hypothetical protein
VSTVTATLVMRGPRLTLRPGPVLSGFMRVGCTIDFPIGRREQAPMTRVVHLRARDLLWLAEHMEQHVWTIQGAGAVGDGPEFLNLDLQIRLLMLEGELGDEDMPLFLALRLGGLAREKQRRPDHRPLEEPIAATPEQVAQSRRAAERSPQARSSGTSRPLASERDAQPTPASPHTSETPQTSLRLCASAREKQRRPHHRPLEEPIADTPEQVAQSRRAAERSPQARSSGTPRPSASERDAQPTPASPRHVRDTPDLSAALRLCARKTTPTPTTARSKSRSPTHPNRSRRAAEPQSAHLKRDRRGHPGRRHRSGTPSRQGRRPMLANITLRRRGGVSGAAGKVAASLDTGRRARRYFSGTQETSDVHRIHPHPAPWARGA